MISRVHFRDVCPWTGLLLLILLQLPSRGCAVRWEPGSGAVFVQRSALLQLGRSQREEEIVTDHEESSKTGVRDVGVRLVPPPRQELLLEPLESQKLQAVQVSEHRPNTKIERKVQSPLVTHPAISVASPHPVTSHVLPDLVKSPKSPISPELVSTASEHAAAGAEARVNGSATPRLVAAARVSQALGPTASEGAMPGAESGGVAKISMPRSVAAVRSLPQQALLQLKRRAPHIGGLLVSLLLLFTGFLALTVTAICLFSDLRSTFPQVLSAPRQEHHQRQQEQYRRRQHLMKEDPSPRPSFVSLPPRSAADVKHPPTSVADIKPSVLSRQASLSSFNAPSVQACAWQNTPKHSPRNSQIPPIALRPSTMTPRITFGESKHAPPSSTVSGQSTPGGTSPEGSPQDGNGEHLCACLVVPEGMELVFAVRDLITKDRQQVSFSITDLGGQPLSHVIVNEMGSSFHGMVLQLLDQTPLAWVRTAQVFDGRSCSAQICWAGGDVYANVSREEARPQNRYTLRDTRGQLLYTFYGNFQERAVNIINPLGHLVGDTESWRLEDEDIPFFQVRVAPNVDAGLLLCGLLAVQKMEAQHVSL